MPSSTPSPTRGLVLVCLAGVLWGTGGVAVQLVREHADLSAAVVSAYRTGIAALVLLMAVVATRRVRATWRLARSRPGLLVVVGLATGAYQALYFTSVVLVGVTVATVVSLGTAPLVLALADVVRHRRLPGRARVLQLGAALGGLVLISLTTGHGGASAGEGSPVLGVVAALASGTGFALATALGERAARDASPLALTTVTTVVGAAALVPLALVTGGPLGTTDPVAIGWLLYLGVATFALAYGLLYAGLRSTSSSAAVLASLLEPVAAAALAVAVLGERVPPPGLVGIALVLAAIAMSPRTERDVVVDAVPAPAAERAPGRDP